jgi:Zn-dependent M16 (insulinase) family peptidase
MQEFYGNFYHPTNARVYFYGSTPEAERLSMLSNALEGFESNPAALEDSAIRGAEPFSAPRVVELQYPSATTSGGAYVVSCWGMGSATEGVPTADEFALTVLSNLLLGSTSAPLYAALLTSNLGSPITDGMVSGKEVLCDGELVLGGVGGLIGIGGGGGG